MRPDSLVESRKMPEQPFSGGYGFENFSFEQNPFVSSGADPKTPTNTAMFESRMGQYQQAIDAGMTPEQALTFIGKPDTGVGDKDLQIIDTMMDKAFDTDRLKEQLRIKNEFEKERMAQAAPYKLLFNLPNQMMNVAAMELAGAGKYAQIMDAGIARMPSLSPSAVNVTRNPSKYF